MDASAAGLMCVFEPHDGKCRCIYCGRTVAAPDCNRTFARCETPRDPMQCRHIGPPFDATVTAQNCGCSSAEAKLTVFECAVHGECLPTYRRGDLSEPVKTCKGCESYEASPSSRPAT